MTFGLDVPQNYPCRNVLTLYLSQPGWQEKIPQPDMHSARESLKVKAFLAHGNLTCVTGYQALSPAGSVLVPHVWMELFGGSTSCEVISFAMLAAGPGLGPLSLRLLYHCHSPFLEQSTSFTQSGLLCPEGCAQTLWRPYFSPSPDPRSKVGACHPQGRSVHPASPSACSCSDTGCGLLQTHSACSPSRPIHSMAKPRFILLLAWSSSVPNPSCTVLCPNRPSISFSDARFEVYTDVTGSADSGSEALSHVDFPRWILC